MNELPFVTTPELFTAELVKLRNLREQVKTKQPRTRRLSNKERILIHAKTDGQCHVCSRKLNADEYEADHVKPHSSGGGNVVENFLPACRTCNNYRWNYLSDEFQWILKLGVWLKTEIEKETAIGKLASNAFIKYEIRRETRRRKPRS